MNGAPNKRSKRSWWYLLLLVQYAAVLWPPFYRKAEPYWIGIPRGGGGACRTIDPRQ